MSSPRLPFSNVLKASRIGTPEYPAVRCAIGSDDEGPLTDAVLADLERRGIAVGRAVGGAVARGEADLGIETQASIDPLDRREIDATEATGTPE